MADRYEKCPRSLIRSGLPSECVHLYLLLRTFDGPRGCFPSQETLWSILKCSERSLNRYLDRLETAGWIARQRKWVTDGAKLRHACVYTFSDSELPSVATQTGSELPSVATHIQSELPNATRVNCHQNRRNLDLGTETISCASSDARDSDLALASTTPKTGSLKAKQERWFSEQFWPAFWRREGRKDAFKAFVAHVKTEADFRALMDGLEQRRAEMESRELRFRRTPGPWIRSEVWREPVETSPATTPDDMWASVPYHQRPTDEDVA